ncbi:MAG: hypothetical protein V4733_05310 [Verrucomicrobiota bacterium]
MSDEPSQPSDETNPGNPQLENDLWSLDEEADSNFRGETTPASEAQSPVKSWLPERRPSLDPEVVKQMPETEETAERIFETAFPSKLPRRIAPSGRRANRDFQPLQPENVWPDIENDANDDPTTWDDPDVLAALPENAGDHPAPEPPDSMVTAAPDPLPATPARRSLTRSEILATVVLALLLIGAGAAAYYFSIHRIPAEENVTVDYPVKGTQLTVVSANTYWRTPATTGENPDRVRRGTALIPAVRLTFEKPGGAVRVIFRNDAGESVGDLLSRNVTATGPMVISGTAGFDHLALHAAYRTENRKQWTAEIFEGPDENAPAASFQKLLTVPVSARRQP